ncbi:signal peptidase I [Sphingomonas arenae]|uniref:signal peptidase I n=1 Tax=Sphingomonas arenae TaxID=2812555 RepID=UPI003AF45F41
MSDEVQTLTPDQLPAADPAPSAAASSKRSAVWREIKGLSLVLLAVLLFHSFVAKPFYIPSESMMPGLLKGDRLVVSKYPYGWSFVSPTIPNPVGIFRSLVLRDPTASWGVTLPFSEGRVWGKVPERGDVVIVTPPGMNEDYIKRVVGLPGDTIEVRDGRLIINGLAVRREVRPPAMIPVDENAPCGLEFLGFKVQAADGNFYCRLPIVRETLPNGATYDTIDLETSQGDTYGPVKVEPGHLFLMGDNRDRSADSRFALGGSSHGLGGPVPWENIGGRAEFITFSLDGSTQWYNPLSWPGAFRSGRAGTSLRPATAD